MKNNLVLLALLAVMSVSCKAVEEVSINEKLKDERIKAFCIDWNWGPPGPFARPGLWADADPKEHLEWYKELGVNTIQTFAVSCNGYAWYDSDVVPQQPGLKHDFLTEMVELGHAEGMRVMGYFCIAANTRWGKENPDQTIGLERHHIPLTDEYLDLLARSIEDALVKTNMDGFMVDWVWGPRTLSWNPANEQPWLECEKELFEQVMGKPFPGEDKLTDEDHLKYEQITVERCWDVIYKTAKRVKPDCIIWLSCAHPTHPSVLGSKMFEQVDWLMNENPKTEYIHKARHTAGPNTKIMQCLVGWGENHDAQTFLDDPKNDDIGIYGFAAADPETGFPKKQDANTRNIEALRKVFNEE
ncbi:hypothetical protein [Coraliomargarita akajimensis]|uniref:Uncharacterized protein n=1 Tax=Coraliomargarita akajimensis (strain DSM 45221 / IAM 15411 / JCM 23193 / KCTC 12865 / 04OKA010-24) TaxID=583355 RepID=D5ENB6_CORAD|nr:hypothetical protein [Coraliomargarita akajimensis]ADE53551.1 hypothetical protein Caka_0526 [Coraliomargarita akajimensis DSM 45221]